MALVQRREVLPLHMPRPVCETDLHLIKRAGRLTSAANAVGEIDLRAVAASYQKESGVSGIEAAGLAAATLTAALKASLAGSQVTPEQATEAAKAEVRTAAKRRAREVRGEDWRAAREAEDGPLGDVSRDANRSALDARASRAVADKDERLADDAAARRAVREERSCAAASRRTLSEARAFCGVRSTSRRPLSLGGGDIVGVGSLTPSSSSSIIANDPALQRARSLCTGASNVIAQLEVQNQALRQKQVASSASRKTLAVNLNTASKSSIGNTPLDDALMARARDLLQDYQPAGQTRRPPVPSAKAESRYMSPQGGSPKNESRPDADGAATLARAKHLCAEVSLELNGKRGASLSRR